MKKQWLVKTLALGIVALFISVSFQPVFADDFEQFDERLNESKPDNNERMDGGFENSECFVEGETTCTFFRDISFRRILLFIIGYYLFQLAWAYHYRVRATGYFGSSWVEPNSKIVFYYPAYGWIYTNGINGKKNYSGYFYGNLSGNAPQALSTDYEGAKGFKGICAHNWSTGYTYFKGTALKVAITPGEPYP